MGAKEPGTRARLDAVTQLKFARRMTRLLVGCAVIFFAVPLLALIAKSTPSTVIDQLSSYETRMAIAVSLVAVTIALTFIVILGTPTAYVLARRGVRPSRALEVLFDLPMVLPPAVAGIALLAAFGPGSPIGDALSSIGMQVALTRTAVIVALIFVAGPLYIRQAQAAFAATDNSILDSARTSGVGSLESFLRVELPLAKNGIVAGVALSGARALGEFGATMMFAGSVVGVTQTITLAIYGSLDARPDASYALASLLLLMTVLLSLAARAVGSRGIGPVAS
ncbi:MAG: ABC transporter permease subunit [Solirubrobacterales bacterium]